MRSDPPSSPATLRSRAHHARCGTAIIARSIGRPEIPSPPSLFESDDRQWRYRASARCASAASRRCVAGTGCGSERIEHARPLLRVGDAAPLCARRAKRRPASRPRGPTAHSHSRFHHCLVSPIGGVQMRSSAIPAAAAAEWKRRGGSSGGSSVRSNVP